MCGIVGYAGSKEAKNVLLAGLEKLEYRGYDSAGIALICKSGLTVCKAKGKIAKLEEKLRMCSLPDSSIGIGHTRWATHGEPSERNSHPHTAGKVTLVHNGIIENYHELKENLLLTGREFRSDTDTEVICHLLDCCYHGNPVNAIREVTNKLKGSYALAVLFEDIPDSVFAVRCDSPLIIGLGEGENFIASDIPAILEFTREYIQLDAGEIAEITREKVLIYDSSSGCIISKSPLRADWDAESAELGGYPHFMLKEIFEQPAVLRRLINAHTDRGAEKIFSREIPDTRFIKRIVIVACGSAYNAGILGKYVIERFCKIPTEVAIASEFRYRDPLLLDGDAVIVISQSGETADSVAAMRLAKQRNTPVIGIVNTVGSTVAREADHTVYLSAGPEIAVATTKAYTAQVALLHLLAIRLAAERGTLSHNDTELLLEEIKKVPDLAASYLNDLKIDELRETAEKYKFAHDLFIIGRGRDYALALEGAMKIKEISYIHCEAYAAGELKHGTIALIDSNTPVLILITEEDLAEKTVSGAKEVASRKGKIVIFASENFESPRDLAHSIINIGDLRTFGAHIAAAIPVQLFAYFIARARECDIDKPRNLAKSVTVE